MNERARGVLKIAWPWLLIAALCIMFFGDSLFAGKAFMLRDVWGGWLGGRALQKRAIWSGHFPIWDPCEGCGQLLLGNSSSGVFYLPHIIFDIVPIVTALKLSELLHMFITIAGMYRLLRSWNCRPAAALIGAIASGMGTCWLAYMEWPYASGVFAWTPWVMLFASQLADRAGDSSRKRANWIINLRSCFTAIAKLTIVFALQFLAGHPDVWFFCTLMLLMYVAVEFPVRVGWLGAIRTWQGMAIAAILAALIASPEWLMLAQRVPLSVRGNAFDPLMSEASIHPAHWVTMLLPYLFGRAGYPTPQRYWGITLNEFWEGTCYVGLLPLGLAISALIGGWSKTDKLRRARLAFLATLLLVGIILASGQYTPIYLFVHNHLPGMGKMRWPSKALILVHFALAMLAALGAERLLRSREATDGKLMQLIVAAVFCIATIVFAIALVQSKNPSLFQSLTLNRTSADAEHLDDFHRQLVGGLIVMLASATVLVAMNFRRVRLDVVAWSLVAICYFDLFHISRQVHPIVSDSIYQMPDSLPDQVLGPHGPLDRIASNYAAMAQMMYGNSNAADFDAYKPLAVGDMWLRYDVSNIWASGLELERYAQMGSIPAYTDDVTANRLADVMSVTHLIGWRNRPEYWNGQPPNIAHVFKRESAMPRASLVLNWLKPNSLQSGASMLLSPQFDLTFNALLEPDFAGNPPPAPDSAARAIHAAIKSVKYDWDRCDIDLETDGEALLVLNDIFYPGWHATVDNEPARIYCANLIFRGVLVNKGATHVTFTYGPWQFRVGMMLSIGTILAMITGWVFWRTKSIRRDVDSPPASSPELPIPVFSPVAKSTTTTTIDIPIPPVRRRPR